VFSVTLSEDAKDPIFSDVEANFNVPAVEEMEDEDDIAGMIPDGTTVSAERVVRIIHDFPVVPSLWLPTFGFSSSRVIDIGAVNTGVSLVFFTLGFVVLEVAMAYFFRGSDDKLVRPLVRVAGVFLVFWSFYGHEIFWDNLLASLFPNALRGGADVEILHPQNSVITFAGEHLELVIVSSFLTIPIGLLIGIFVTREDYREFLPLMTNLVNLGQTIPTLAVIAIFRPIIGLGFTPAIIALFIYGLLPVVRNTIAGLEGVDRFTIDSAKGMGMTPAQILLRIELPIASSIIMAGVRTSMVINVGTAALGAYVISGGLGIPIANGLSRQINPWILLGAIPAALLAVLIDYILGRLEYVLTPRGLQIEG
jgi:osmoprotectant transport system permease protein